MHGKDSTPEETIKKITKILKRAGLFIEEVSWKHPVPHVWSVHVREKSCPALSVNGKGTTKALALASALGEFMERVMTGYSFSDYALIGIKAQKEFLFTPDEKWFAPGKKTFPKKLLTKELHVLYDPAGELKGQDLVDRMSGGCGKNAICALPFERVRDKKTIYFPINILDNIYASNGMAAGNTKEEALVQALSEILERYAKTEIIRKGIALPDIPKAYYAGFPHIVKAIEALKGAGFRVLVKDASLGGRYPVVNVTIVEAKTKKCFLAFGAHPSFEIALMRTVTELLQGQKLAKFCGLKKAAKNKKEVKEQSNLISHFIDSSGIVSEGFFENKPAYQFHFFDLVGARKDEEDYLFSVFKRSKKEVYINAISIDGFYVCRVIVPGWSEVYPATDLVYENNNRARHFVKYLVKLSVCTQAELKKVLVLLDEGIVGEHEIVTDVLGIALDDRSPWERLCFGELKLLVLLDLKKKSKAVDQLDWCFDVGCVREEKKDVYECLASLLEGKDTTGTKKSIILKSNKIFNGIDVFKELFSKSGVMLGIRSHKKILNAFSRSRKCL